MRLLLLSVSLFSLLSIGAQTIDTKTEGETFQHFWSFGVGAGRANEGLRAAWQEQLKLVHDACGFHYVRMHDIFNDDMFVCFPHNDGSITYNWQYVDEVYDRMLAIGVRPFVELAFFPSSLAAANSKTNFWYRSHVSVDSTKYDQWHNLVEAFTQHLVGRYGLEEVSNWYFEVWNEPNLTGTGGFLHGTRSQYFRLYKEAALAVKSVSPRLRVGGPATSNFIADHRHDGEILDNSKSVFYSQDQINQQQWKGIWIEQFLRFCEDNKLPVDFVSTHAYPTDYALDPVSGKGKDAIRYVHSLRDDLSWLRQTIDKSHFAGAEIHITEWSTSPSSRDAMHDLLPPAAYIMKTSLDNVGRATSVMYWTFTDIFEEKGGGSEIFHGGFGMINFQGIVKPAFHAYRMLHQLGNQRLYYQDPLVVTRHSASGKITALAFNYPDEFIPTVPAARNAKSFMQASTKSLHLTLTNLKPGAAFLVETLDYEHGNAYEEWLAIGKPHSPTREQTAYLKEKVALTLKQTVNATAEGTLTINRELQPWTCMLIHEL